MNVTKKRCKYLFIDIYIVMLDNRQRMSTIKIFSKKFEASATLIEAIEIGLATYLSYSLSFIVTSESIRLIVLPYLKVLSSTRHLPADLKYSPLLWRDANKLDLIVMPL